MSLVEDFETTIKVIVVGNGGVGKSSMIRKFCTGEFTDTYSPKTPPADTLAPAAPQGFPPSPGSRNPMPNPLSQTESGTCSRGLRSEYLLRRLSRHQVQEDDWGRLPGKGAVHQFDRTGVRPPAPASLPSLPPPLQCPPMLPVDAPQPSASGKLALSWAKSPEVVCLPCRWFNANQRDTDNRSWHCARDRQTETGTQSV